METILAPTLLDRSLPRLNRHVRDILLVVGGSLCVAGMAQVRIPLPFTPIPITGQTFAVLLVGAVLGARRGAASLVLYLIQGMLGLPFFAGGASGLGASVETRVNSRVCGAPPRPAGMVRMSLSPLSEAV